jgi:hypothetical protein
MVLVFCLLLLFTVKNSHFDSIYFNYTVAQSDFFAWFYIFQKDNKFYIFKKYYSWFILCYIKQIYIYGNIDFFLYFFAILFYFLLFYYWWILISKPYYSWINTLYLGIWIHDFLTAASASLFNRYLERR